MDIDMIPNRKEDYEYAGRLISDNVPAEAIAKAKQIFDDEPKILQALTVPTISNLEKKRAVKELFPEEIQDFICNIIDNYDISRINNLFLAYEERMLIRNQTVKAVITCIEQPTEEEIDGYRELIQKDTGAEKIAFEVKIDTSIIGGAIIEAGGKTYDFSLKSNYENLKSQMMGKNNGGMSIDTSDVISVLKNSIIDFESHMAIGESGTVVRLGDGIASVYGMDHVMYGELVQFETGAIGIVQNIEEKDVGVILLGDDHGISEGTKVTRTKKRAGVPVGEKIIGRIINALGSPIDGGPEIEASDYYPIESEAPGIMARQSVNKPLHTGILAIDSMFPIGRGQRELIIGDRQTGKTSIAVDTILNQKGENTICIYVAIGQKASNVATLVDTLRKRGAMDYTIVVAATASESAPLQYISPYTGTAIGEYFMHKGRDVLIIYDDLSKHAVSYRAISLLLHRPPGREAYPGDVFYLHSRLLERSCRLSEINGGGSMTALPIIETQAGDVAAYIPTNVISITDGQIFLETELFFSGVRPAVNVGLSVSRVGGAAQTKAMKKSSGSLRIDLSQFREMEIFTQFSSELDKSTKDLLDYGHVLVELLKQPLHESLAMHEQVVLLIVAVNKLMNPVPVSRVNDFKDSMLDFFAAQHKEIYDELDKEKNLSDELKEAILSAAKEFIAEYPV